MTELTKDAVRAMRARADAATAGPWEAKGNTLYLSDDEWHAFLGHRETVTFIAAARTDLPLLAESWLAQHAEIERLKQWKAEHLIVTADFQAIGKLIGVGLGEYVHDKIEPFIRAIIAERDDLRRRLEEAEKAVESITKTLNDCDSPLDDY